MHLTQGEGWAIVIGAVVGLGTTISVILICAGKAAIHAWRKTFELGRSSGRNS